MCLLNILKNKLTPRTCSFRGLQLFENLWSVRQYFIVLSFFCCYFQNVFPLVHHIQFKFVGNNIYDFAWKFQITATDKYPGSSQNFYFLHAFSDNFPFIIAFCSLVISDCNNSNNSVGVLRWVPRLLIWWCYAMLQIKLLQEDFNSELVIC